MKTILNAIGWVMLAAASFGMGVWMVLAVANSSGVCL